MAEEATIVQEQPSDPSYQQYREDRRAGKTPGEATGTPPASEDTPPEATTQDSPPAEETPQATEPDDAQRKRRERNEKRWQRMNSNLRGMREENAQLRGEITALREVVEKLATPQSQTPPIRESYETEEAYLDAAIAWRNSHQPTQELAASPPAQQPGQDAPPASGNDAFAALIEAGEDRYDDFEQVVLNSSVQVGQLALEAILESDVGADVAYYLAQHAEEANALRTLRPLAFAKAWAKLEAKFANGNDPPQEDQTPPVDTPPAQREPEPINPIRGADAETVNPPLENLSYRDYRARRLKEQRR